MTNKKNTEKIKYISSLTDEEIRYEIDKIYARLKEIDMFRQVQEGFPEDYVNPYLSVLENDFNRLKKELELYQSLLFES